MSRWKNARSHHRSAHRSKAGKSRQARVSTDWKRRLIVESLESRILLIGEPLIEGVAPLPPTGQSVSAAIDQLTITVNEDLDPVSANDLSHWRLTGAGSDGVLDTTDDFEHSLTLFSTYTSGTTLVLDIDARANRFRKVSIDSQRLPG